MKTVRIYQPGQYAVNQNVELEPAQSLHISKVLRLTPGEKIILFCGSNKQFDAIITSSYKKKVWVNILSEQIVNRESPHALHLVQAISKGARMEIVIQKAVELGVASIAPIITERCVMQLDATRMEKKQRQWQEIAKSACEQSGRNSLPLISPIYSLNEYLQHNITMIQAMEKLVLHPQSGKNWREYRINSINTLLLIGPEGGFSVQELSHVLSYNFKPLTLGPRILRTETAAIAALSILQAIWGDL